MQFPAPLLRGTLIQRYKRFLADIRLESGETITATCPNTGSMMGLTTPGLPVWVSTSDSPTRKYKHTWEMLEVDLGTGAEAARQGGPGMSLLMMRINSLRIYIRFGQPVPVKIQADSSAAAPANNRVKQR